MIVHPFPPLYDEESRILILGSFPSVKSREQNFFYGHPQNRFWKVTAAVFGSPVPVTIEEKKVFLHSNHIALWDVIASCKIEGSSDASIRNVTANDLTPILRAATVLRDAPAGRIFTNGTASYDLYRKYILPVNGIEPVKLPSTSPANAAGPVERLIEAWRIIAECRETKSKAVCERNAHRFFRVYTTNCDAKGPFVVYNNCVWMGFRKPGSVSAVFSDAFILRG